MAISFPRDFPTVKGFTNGSTFMPLYTQTRALSGGGSVEVADLATMRWAGKYQTTNLLDVEYGEWSAWLDSLRGGIKQFKGYHPLRKYPTTYPLGWAGLTKAVGGAPFTGTANLVSIAGSNVEVVVDGLPASFVLQEGDFLSFPIGGVEMLYRITEGSTSSGGGSITVGIVPPVLASASSSVVVTLEKPFCLMRLVGDTVRSIRPARIASISFSGEQTLI